MRSKLLGAALVAALSTPVLANDYYVDQTGANGAFTSIQAALNAVPSGTAANRTRILIMPGTYTETTGANANLNIAKPFITMIGQGPNPSSVIIQNNVAGLTGATRIQSSANDFVASNLTFQNTLGSGNGVAVALRNSADRSAFSNVRIVGYQDTLLAENKARQYYTNSFITGNTDFIFGSATAVFQSDTINSTTNGFAITAAETDPHTAIGFVFLDSILTRSAVSPNNGASPNSVVLGRPWHWAPSDGSKVASVTFINTKMDTQVEAVGWDKWDGAGSPPANNTDPDATTRYAEFNSMNISGSPLSLSGRVSWEDPMTQIQADAYENLTNIFSGPTFWNNNPTLQPEYIGTTHPGFTYTDQSGVTPWDPFTSLASIPEPSSILLTLGSAALLFWRRARRSNR